MRHIRLLGVLVAAVLLTATAPSAVAGAPTAQDELAAARHATAALHTQTEATARGWVDTGLPCYDNPVPGPGSGGMGVHWVRDGETLTSAPDAARPTVLVYDPVTLHLVAVEYVVAVDAWTGSEPPQLYGRTFTEMALPDGTPVYKLHAWIWKPNPNGMFADFNPDVHLCP